MIKFFVEGIPAPQGSKNVFIRGGRAVVTEASKKVKPWREAVALACIEEMNRAGYMKKFLDREISFIISVRFYLPIPKRVPTGYPHHLKYPDLDKLVRCVFDGITQSGCVWNDDRQVVKIKASKEYAPVGGQTGAEIEIY
jgi:Holliday junction resolvase RusA-like endonuclease